MVRVIDLFFIFSEYLFVFFHPRVKSIQYMYDIYIERHYGIFLKVKYIFTYPKITLKYVINARSNNIWMYFVTTFTILYGQFLSK